MKKRDPLGSWSDDALRSYHLDPQFEKLPWWQKKDAEGNFERNSFDEANDVLVIPSKKGKVKLRPEPLLWEILRRHPHLPLLRQKISPLYCDDSSDPNRRFEAENFYHDRWNGAGGYSMLLLSAAGAKTWLSLSPKHRSQFSRGLHQFFQNSKNLPTNKTLTIARPPAIATDNIRTAEAARAHYIWQGPVEDLTQLKISELAERLKQQGLLFLPLEIDPNMSRDEIRNGVLDLLDEFLDGSSRREPTRARIIANFIERGEILPNEKGKGAPPRPRSTFNLTQGKYQTLEILDSTDPLKPVARKNAKTMFADFSLV